MVRYETNIDTVAIQLTFGTAKEQRAMFNKLWQWIIVRRLGDIKLDKKKSNDRVNVYNLLHSKNKLATLHTGYTRRKDKISNRYIQQFYIRIRWCGLKRFKPKLDEASSNALMTICAYLNSIGTSYRFVELDIALDMLCPFHNVLGAISTTMKVPNVPYNPLGFIQYFNGVPTTYIENYSDLQKRNNAFMRFYLYDKSAKESLDTKVTRAELKLQNRFFLRYGFNLKSIINAISKYSVVCFSNSMRKQQTVTKYNCIKKLDSNEVCKLEYENFKIYPDYNKIKEFIIQVQTVYVEPYYRTIEFPPLDIMNELSKNL